MSNLKKKFSVVAKKLAELEPGTHSILEIVQEIKRIENLKVDLEQLEKNSTFYTNYGDTCNISDLYVDITYQRKVRLQKLLNQLETLEGFDTSVAGTIDTIVRPNIGKSGRCFVWDGLRRTIMYGLCGGKIVRISPSTHDKELTDEECVQKEAKLFKIRNADSEKMTPEEIFKSKVVYADEVALDQLSILYKAKLNIEGLTPFCAKLGGFTLFEKCYHEAVKEGRLKSFRKSIIEASKIMQDAWSADEKISVYVLCGLAYLLEINNVDELGYDAIPEAVIDWVDDNEAKQSDITNVRVHGKAIICIAYYFAHYVIGDEYENGLEDIITGRLEEAGVATSDIAFLKNPKFQKMSF